MKGSAFHGVQQLLIFSENTYTKEQELKIHYLNMLPPGIFHICFSIRAMLQSVVCICCGFFSFLNQLPDFWAMNVCQDWVKFSYLLNERFLISVYIKKKKEKYKTSLNHNWKSEVEVHLKRQSAFFGILYH